jgi:hypothetical protein
MNRRSVDIHSGLGFGGYALGCTRGWMKRNDKSESRYASYVENKIQLGIVHLRSSFECPEPARPGPSDLFERFKVTSGQ